MNKKAIEMSASFLVGLIIAIILFVFVSKLIADTFFPFFIGSGEDKELSKYEIIQVESSVLNCIESYEQIINKASEENGLPKTLIKSLIIQESNCDKNAVSSVGAVGLTQLISSTAKDLGLNVPDYGTQEIVIDNKKKEISKCNKNSINNCDMENDERFDAEKNILAGSKYLKQQLDEFENIELALAAYNWGPSKVKTNCYERIELCNFGDNEETPEYIVKVLGIEAGLA